MRSDVRPDYSSSDETSPASFRLTPRITPEAMEALTQLLRTTPSPALREVLQRRAADFARAGTPDGCAAQIVALLLGDLQRQRWVVEARDEELWVTPPQEPIDEPAVEVKRRLRASLLELRADQLQDGAVQAFLQRMETPRTHEGRRVSVLDLIDDGRTLASLLAEVRALPSGERAVALDRVIRPTVEVATAEARCGATGLSLLDVWRYFRHTWSLEYRSTPGRTLFLLIRNNARPSRPVMAIACLTNAQLQIRRRDAWIGWTTPCLIERLRAVPVSWGVEREALLRTVQEARAQIRTDDLLERAGGADGEALEASLLAVSKEAAGARTAALQDRAAQSRRGEAVPPMKRLPVDARGQVDWRRASEDLLFVRKRAETLAKLLFAERILAALPDDMPDAAERLSASDEAMRALAVATREVRKVGLASRLLELNVCGAVPPYRELLGGKLAALAVASAEVCDRYATRYRDQASEIASQMAGRAIVRDASVYVITTTSLYSVASSQYNRLKMKVSTARGPEELYWRDLHLTQGFGTTHLGEEVLRAMREYSTARGVRNVNNRFGEGQSPRLRQAREALDALGLDGNAILQHRSPRRIYGLELFPGAREALRLNRAAGVERPSFSAIADAWRDRWLARRIESDEVLLRVAEQGPGSVRAELTAPRVQLQLFAEAEGDAAPPPVSEVTSELPSHSVERGPASVRAGVMPVSTQLDLFAVGGRVVR